jgi:hypothetical protein
MIELQRGQKKAPKALKSLDAELKSAPAFSLPNAPANTGVRVAACRIPRRGKSRHADGGRGSAFAGGRNAPHRAKADRWTGREIFLSARP